MTADGAPPVVGVIGTGSMGSAVARRVLECCRLYVHDIRPAAVEDLAALGATVSPDPQTLGAVCDVVLLSLPSHAEVDQVIFGERGVLRSLRRGGLLVNLTTGSVLHLARLAGTERTHGIHYVTAPVSQGVDNAALGRLSTFVGGTEQGYALARPVLATYCNEIIYLRDHRAAMAAKLITNLSWYVNAALLPELLALAAKAGIGREDIQRVLTASCGDSWVIRHDIDAVWRGDYDPTFSLGLAVKDLGLIAELAEFLKIPTEMAPAAQAVFGRAHRVYGPDAPELCPVRLMEQRTGVRFGPNPPVPLCMNMPHASGRRPPGDLRHIKDCWLAAALSRVAYRVRLEDQPELAAGAYREPIGEDDLACRCPLPGRCLADMLLQVADD